MCKTEISTGKHIHEVHDHDDITLTPGSGGSAHSSFSICKSYSYEGSGIWALDMEGFDVLELCYPDDFFQ